jgi:rRNA maturation protein Nop10
MPQNPVASTALTWREKCPGCDVVVLTAHYRHCSPRAAYRKQASEPKKNKRQQQALLPCNLEHADTGR